jgi:hypothetical protein
MPRGVVVLGDVIEDGDRAAQGRQFSHEQYQFFLADFSFDGTDSLLEFPVFEGWGNHDGPPEGKEKHGYAELIQNRSFEEGVPLSLSITPYLLAVENLALRQQVAVYKHSVERPKLRPRDRAFWVWLSRL